MYVIFMHIGTLSILIFFNICYQKLNIYHYIYHIYIVLKTGFTCKWSINITIMNKFVKITGKVISSNINWGK